MDPFERLEIMGLSASVYALVFAWVIPTVLYIVARWRNHHAPVRDPQLGLKLALGYFAVTALQIALAGATFVFYAMLTHTDDKSDMYRAGFGMVVPGLIVFGLHVGLLQRTNQAFFPGVRRLLNGYNLLITGTFGFIGLILAFESLFKKGGAGELGRVAGAMVLVYGSAWAIAGVAFGRLVLGEPPESGDAMLPPAPPPPGAPVPSNQLPALGGGAFPPIAPK